MIFYNLGSLVGKTVHNSKGLFTSSLSDYPWTPSKLSLFKNQVSDIYRKRHLNPIPFPPHWPHFKSSAFSRFHRGRYVCKLIRKISRLFCQSRPAVYFRLLNMKHLRGIYFKISIRCGKKTLHFRAG